MTKQKPSYYRVPDCYWQRIHFVRPRFKSNIENVLLYMAGECCRIPDCKCDEYSKRYYDAIRLFPGNIDMAEKTLQNWRTEIPALFGFYVEDKEADITRTSKMATFLYENQDLTQFFRLFLLSFQFPGGHMKPQDIAKIIASKIKFKPASVIIRVLLAGNAVLSAKDTAREMSISAEEATYCILNDTRVTSGLLSAEEIARTILDNRQNHTKYYNAKDGQSKSLTGKSRTKGDMTRYAGDILDYMVLADLLEKDNGYFRLKGNELEAINIFLEDKTWFSGYDKFYAEERFDTTELSSVEPEWFSYVNNSMKPDIFQTAIGCLLHSDDEINLVFGDRIQSIVSGERSTKEIGNLGEAIICGHEKMRLKINGYGEQFIKLVQIVDSPSYHPGFDIDSFEGDGTENHRYIEVKTTVSKQKIRMYGFHMSPNEWRVANTIKEHYCVYRLMISADSKELIVLRNPIALYKSDKIEAMPRDGMEVSFDSKDFETTELLAWKN